MTHRWRRGWGMFVIVLGACQDPTAAPADRGWVDVRTAIHVHTVHSHDACDGDPKPGGTPNAQCLVDFRAGICESAMDYVFLTDHDDSMASVPFAELLLPFVEPGDELLGDGGQGLRIHCANGHRATLIPGTENDLIAAGLDHHPPAEDLAALYDGRDAESVEAMQTAGALVFTSHSERWQTEEIAGIPVDGIELYNVHAALLTGALGVGNVAPFLRSNGPGPDVDLVFLPLMGDIEINFVHWGALAAQRKTVGIASHDIHRNSLPGPAADGERLDSYRRVLSWFYNAVRVKEPSLGAVKEALGAGRLYIANNALGAVAGFDAYLMNGAGERIEIGEERTFGPGIVAHLIPPTPPAHPAGTAPPTVTIKLVEMLPEDGATTTVAEGQGPIDAEITGPGVYRVEVELRATHLLPRLEGAEDWVQDPLIWVRTNPFYLRP